MKHLLSRQNITLVVCLALSCLFLGLTLAHIRPTTPLANPTSIANQKFIANKPAQMARQKLDHFPLFGDYIPSSAQNSAEIPKTMLNLELIGILKASMPQNSQALIRVADNEEKLYFINDPLPGGAVLIRVLDNAILLKRNGKIERLTLPKEALDTNATDAPPLQFEN